MKIAIDARMYGYENAGIGRYIVNLISELAKQDNENEYVILLRNKYFNKLNFQNKKWSKVKVESRHYSFSEQLKVFRALKNIAPDVVHFPHFNVPVMYKGKCVVTIHDLSMHKRTGMSATTLPVWLYAVKRAGYKSVFRRAVGMATEIIVPSEFVKIELVRGYPSSKNKTSVVYEGIDKAIYQKAVGEGILRREKIEKPYFLYAGNAYPHKNIKRAIEAVVYLNEQDGYQATLVIVTTKNIFRKRLEDIVDKSAAGDCVKILDFLPNERLAYLFKNSAAFVYPSRVEGFGLPGLEAMANKTLLIASDIPVFKEVYKDNALYFNPLDFSSIARAMQEVLSMEKDERTEKVEKAYSHAMKFDWSQTAKETIKIYEDAAKRLTA